MELFKVVNDNVTFDPETLMLIPFRKIWDRDKSKNKTIALAELSTIFFYSDFKSDFYDMLDETEKLEQIKSYVVGLPEDWKPDEVFNKAVEFYKERQKTISLKLLESARRAMDKISKYFDTVDLHAVDKQGKLLFNVSQFSTTIKNAGEMTESLRKLEQQVKKELTEKKGNVGSKNKNVFEDGI